MNSYLLRKLTIGYMDFLSVEKRRRFIDSDIPLSEIVVPYHAANAYEDAKTTLQWLEKSEENHVLWFEDKGFPDYRGVETRLPYMLFYRGNLENCGRGVAVVGTRRARYDALQKAFSIGLEASSQNFSVVNGLAEGCDRAAITGALKGSTPPIVVLGCGLDYNYPVMTVKIKQEIIDCGGAVISRFAPSMPPLKHNFPDRNLTVAALSSYVVAVEAPEKSGTLITVDLANQLCRDVFVSSEGIDTSATSAGTRQLWEDGVPVIDSFSDITGCNSRLKVSSSGFRFGDRYYDFTVV